jgi:hypothetical protein
MLVIVKEVKTGKELLKKKMSIIPDSKYIVLSDSEDNEKKYFVLNKEFKVYFEDYCEDICTLTVMDVTNLKDKVKKNAVKEFAKILDLDISFNADGEEDE